jgi:hypothetical protein
MREPLAFRCRTAAAFLRNGASLPTAARVIRHGYVARALPLT